MYGEAGITALMSSRTKTNFFVYTDDTPPGEEMLVRDVTPWEALMRGLSSPEYNGVRCDILKTHLTEHRVVHPKRGLVSTKFVEMSPRLYGGEPSLTGYVGQRLEKRWYVQRWRKDDMRRQGLCRVTSVREKPVDMPLNSHAVYPTFLELPGCEDIQGVNHPETLYKAWNSLVSAVCTHGILPRLSVANAACVHHMVHHPKYSRVYLGTIHEEAFEAVLLALSTEDTPAHLDVYRSVEQAISTYKGELGLP